MSETMLGGEPVLDLLLHRLRTALKRRNLKNTSQREMIIAAMVENSGHLTPEEILNLTLKRYPNCKLGIATVYRALNFFEEEGIASSLSFGNDGKKFELCSKSHHDHLICTSCGKIVEFFNPKIEEIQSEVARENGFELLGHEMQLLGVCASCAAKKLEQKDDY